MQLSTTELNRAVIVECAGLRGNKKPITTGVIRSKTIFKEPRALCKQLVLYQAQAKIEEDKCDKSEQSNGPRPGSLRRFVAFFSSDVHWDRFATHGSFGCRMLSIQHQLHSQKRSLRQVCFKGSNRSFGDWPVKFEEKVHGLDQRRNILFYSLATISISSNRKQWFSNYCSARVISSPR